MFMPMVMVVVVMSRFFHGADNHFGLIPDLLRGPVPASTPTFDLTVTTSGSRIGRTSTMAMAVVSPAHVTATWTGIFPSNQNDNRCDDSGQKDKTAENSQSNNAT